MARGVLVKEGRKERSSELANSTLAVDECNLSETRGAVVGRAALSQSFDVRVGVDLNCTTALEPNAEPGDERARDVEWLRCGHDALGPLGIRRRVDLLRWDVRHVTHPCARLRRASLLREARARQQTNRQIGPRAVEMKRVQVESVELQRVLPDLLDSLLPCGCGVGLVEPADVDDVLPEPFEGLGAVEVRIHGLRPAERRIRRDGPRD